VSLAGRLEEVGLAEAAEGCFEETGRPQSELMLVENFH